MSVQGDGPSPGRGSFDKATVDRWQVFGGMAGVAALLLSVIGGIQDQVPLSLIAAGVVTLVGVWLLYRWGRRPDQQLTKHFVVPVLLTVVGAATGGLLGGLELRPAAGTAQPGTTTTTTSESPGASDTPAATTGAGAGQTTTTAAVPAGSTGTEFRSGRVELTAGYYIDFDSRGDNGGVTKYDSPKADMQYISGLFADKIVKVETARPSLADCRAATGLNGAVESEVVQEGSAFCVQTSEGRWAGLVVVSVEDYKQVVFDLVVWDKPA
ncbi:hypothetical protein ACWEFJ_26695 [Actinosynnema sp. NPDC004786]